MDRTTSIGPKSYKYALTNCIRPIKLWPNGPCFLLCSFRSDIFPVPRSDLLSCSPERLMGSPSSFIGLATPLCQLVGQGPSSVILRLVGVGSWEGLVGMHPCAFAPPHATSCKSEQSHLLAAFYLCLVPLPYGPEGSSWWVRHYKAGLSTQSDESVVLSAQGVSSSSSLSRQDYFFPLHHHIRFHSSKVSRSLGDICSASDPIKDVIYVATCDGWFCWLLHEYALQLCITCATK